MRTLLNVVWFFFAGFWLAVGYAVAGVVCCVLVVTIPWGIASFRIASYTLWPFGRAVVRKPGTQVMPTLGNVVWLLVAGVWLALGHVATGVALCVTIIGIPMGVACFKLVPVSLLPLGAEIVPTDRAFA